MMDNNKKKSKSAFERRKQKASIVRWVRIGIQIIFLWFYPALFSQAFGALKDISAAIGNGNPITWTMFTGKFVMLCVITIIAGRVFCGWACSFGALGDWLYQFGQFAQKKIKRKLPKIPGKAQTILQKLKYFILVAVLVLCYFGKSDVVTKNSPWTVYSLIMSGGDIAEYKIAIILLIIILIGMIVKERFFCQFLCPYGAVFSLLPHFPILKLKRNEKNCIPNCTLCKRNCPVNLKLQEEEHREGECIMCLRCKYGCPKDNISL